ncbi:hypothetical protein [Chitinophaga japonensis]|uniref:Uncharacterized protein n=1 Tax=Chitinophaga japonensis TaxID=104662 RepID=A0A562T8Y8_CHIJA|nr:hypothetical protein [Chitinophaga japonensis]TWI89280.1 hypothetical protein LX66_3375 [Chitinophaga japonensis]
MKCKKFSFLGLGRHLPPLFHHVEIYFLQKGCSGNEAATFFRHYQARGWKGVKGKPVPSWKTLACDWIYLLKRNAYQKKALYEKANLYPGQTD